MIAHGFMTVDSAADDPAAKDGDGSSNAKLHALHEEIVGVVCKTMTIANDEDRVQLQVIKTLLTVCVGIVLQ